MKIFRFSYSLGMTQDLFILCPELLSSMEIPYSSFYLEVEGFQFCKIGTVEKLKTGAVESNNSCKSMGWFYFYGIYRLFIYSLLILVFVCSICM